jgi:flagellar motor switch protein FliG
MLPLGLPSSLDGNHGPLSFLEDCEPEEVAKVLGEEPYPDAAGVLGVLNPGFADIVLQLMDPKLQETLINLLQHQRAMSASKQTRMAEVLRPKFRILG